LASDVAVGIGEDGILAAGAGELALGEAETRRLHGRGARAVDCSDEHLI